MDWSSFLLGLGVGITISFAIAEWMVRREHRAWMAVSDKYERVIAKLKGGK